MEKGSHAEGLSYEARGGKAWSPLLPGKRTTRMDENCENQQSSKKALLDSGGTKTIVHPKFMKKEEYLDGRLLTTGFNQKDLLPRSSGCLGC